MTGSYPSVVTRAAIGLLAAVSVGAFGHGVGPAKSVKLVFTSFDKVDVQLWIDGKRVVAQHMVVADWTTAEDVTVDARVKRRSKIVLIFGNKKKEAIVGSIAKLKTIYLEPGGPIKMSNDPPALD